MKFIKSFLLTILIISFNSCQKNTLEKVDDFKNKKIEKFEVDEFSITDEILDSAKSNNQNNVHFDGLIFSNKKNDKTILIGLYTDRYRYLEIQFLKNSIPQEIIERIELNESIGKLLTLEEKQRVWENLTKPKNILDEKYFLSNKGFKLNDTKKKILDFYGKPDNYRKINGLEIYDWDFIGDYLINKKTDLTNKKVAKDSYGNRTTFYFKNDKLISMVFNNEIP